MNEQVAIQERWILWFDFKGVCTYAINKSLRQTLGCKDDVVFKKEIKLLPMNYNPLGTKSEDI
jgi:hypothetical protein